MIKESFDVDKWITNIDNRFIEEANPYADSVELSNDKEKIHFNPQHAIIWKSIATLMILIVSGGLFLTHNYEAKNTSLNSDNGDDLYVVEKKKDKEKEENNTSGVSAVMNQDDAANNLQENMRPTGSDIINSEKNSKGETTLNNNESVSVDGKKKDGSQIIMSYDDVKRSEYYQLLSEVIKEKYSFEMGILSQNESGNNVMFSFINSTNEIIVRITDVSSTENYEERKVTSAEVFKYDICNYDVPYSQTIPDEIRTCMDNPIFGDEDFTMEVLLQRLIYSDDSDEKRVSAHFSIETEGYVIEYSFKGVYSKELIKVFCQTHQ